ncbi:ATP-grasp fold amidoligase family protein [Zobellia galactanivorans]|uniref:Uncharacterized protein n=1 Tax=Zobellia galactanivorans (strain DSM 12802 / CCUG 47099 / CIP 106680 / NCIMB 13871 / Dsij) TaxID=63186 RepID=G0L599_ZOBGA|nr:ATP-grasp fold amidoligase family protein [Zobellia galactanivorans]CAZ96062.1 Conserved hypothetical protein [Zobellia galactanivorans]
MNSFFYKIYRKTIVGNLVRNLYHWLQGILPDKIFLAYKYRISMGKKLQLNPPTTLNEKINWLKLYDRRDILTKCADKYKVREIILERIGDKYLVPLYFQTKNPNEIVSENIKDTPCIIKTNHDSSGGIFIYDKEVVDWKELRSQLKKRIRKNYYRKSREWQYKNIKPRIIVEKLLLDSKGNIPLDFKLHCFNGKARMIQVDIDRGTEKHSRNWYDLEWKREPYKWSSPKRSGAFTDPSDTEVEKPQTLNEMIMLSETLASDFDYVRVDWYDVDGKLYFGELTFHHDGGIRPIIPYEWDIRLGQELKLSTRA